MHINYLSHFIIITASYYHENKIVSIQHVIDVNKNIIEKSI
jgi:hypothetical protein